MSLDVSKYRLLVIGGGLCGVLLLAGLGLVFLAQSSYREVKEDVARSQQTLRQLTSRVPYPSEQNVEQVEENLSRLATFSEKFQQRLMSGQPMPKNLERAQFPPLLEQTFTSLSELAAEQGVQLEEDFNFGFSRYALGALPEPRHIPRLTLQVQMVERLCRELFDAGIEAVEDLERDVFETREDAVEEEPSRDRRRSARTAPSAPGRFGQETPLFESEVFVFEFSASDSAFWNVLGALARSPMLSVVRSVELETQVPDSLPGNAYLSALSSLKKRTGFEAGSGGAGPRPAAGDEQTLNLSHEERVIAGRERVRARLVIEVYRFKPQTKEEDAS